MHTVEIACENVFVFCKVPSLCACALKLGLIPIVCMTVVQILMAAATAAAAGVLPHVNPWLALCSLCLNFSWRKHDFACVIMLMAAAAAWAQREDVAGSVLGFLHDLGRERVGA